MPHRVIAPPQPLPPIHYSLTPEILTKNKGFPSLEVNVFKEQILWVFWVLFLFCFLKSKRWVSLYSRVNGLSGRGGWRMLCLEKPEGAGRVLFGKTNLETVMRKKRKQNWDYTQRICNARYHRWTRIWIYSAPYSIYNLQTSDVLFTSSSPFRNLSSTLLFGNVKSFMAGITRKRWWL